MALNQGLMMNVNDAFSGKTVFITGGTGFLGKAIIEKVLRSCPHVEKIYVLIRPRKGIEPSIRLQNEIVQSRIFDCLREQLGLITFTSLVQSKLEAIPGDVTIPMLGLSPSHQHLLQSQVEITIHSAATVQFNEALDIAVDRNCMGALHMLMFVQSLPLLLCHCHISTAYVNSNRPSGKVQERLYPLDFDVNEAIETITKASPDQIDSLSTNLLGTYPNTYALTKSMAEHLLVQHQQSVPLLLYRPTIIGAAWKEPMPGWVDQIAGAGAIFLAVGMGALTILPGNPRNIADIIPVDLAVNTLLHACCVRINKKERDVMIVHGGTSDPRQHPLRWRIPCSIVPAYFQKNPPSNQFFRSKFHMIPTPQQFQLQWFLSYSLPSSVYSTLANHSYSTYHRTQSARLWLLTWKARTMVEVFKPFTQNQWIFKTDAMCQFKSTPEWWVDAQEIVWERYIYNYCVGLKKYVLHEDVINVDIEGVSHTELALSTGRILEWDADHHAISFPGLLSDISWAYTSSRKPGYTKSGLLGRVMGLTGWKEGQHHEASYVPRLPIDSVATIRNHIIESNAVRTAMKQLEQESNQSIREIEASAIEMIDTMAAKVNYQSIRSLGWLLRKLFRQMYTSINVDECGLTRVRELYQHKGTSIVLVPTHRSYVDFLLLSYVFFAYNIPVPYIAAGADFLHMGIMTNLLRASGAYFIRRSFRKDALYTSIFEEYTKYLLSKGYTVEFFIEGMRSRSGKQLHPKFGMLQTVVDCYLEKRVKNIYIVPITIDYEKPLEVLLHQNEVLGEGKIKESLPALFKAIPVARRNFGSIAVEFATPINLCEFIQASTHPSIDRISLVQDLAYDIVDAMISCATCTTSHLVATILLLYRQGIATSELVVQCNWLRKEIIRRNGRVIGTQGRSPTVIVQDALNLLGELIIRRRKDLIEPAINGREQYSNMIGLGYYRNKILHWFHREAILVCAFNALESTRSIEKQHLMEKGLFLYELLMMEFVRKDTKQDVLHLEQGFEQLVTQQVFALDSATRVTLGDVSARPLYSLLQMLVWPFVDSYWVTVKSLFALRPEMEIQSRDLLQRIQWLAETMYHEKRISFYESCSLETLQNAISLLERWKVIERFSHSTKRKKTTNVISMIRLVAPYTNDSALEALAERVSSFRKLPHGNGNAASHLIEQLPTQARM